MKKFKIGIVGVGMVGGALKRYFESEGKTLFLYDKYKNIGSPEAINKAEIIFICVPTPFNRKDGVDLSEIEETFKAIRGGKVIVLKSTATPGTTEKFQRKYPKHRILSNPEFLSEATADEDMRRPDIQIIGYTAKSRPLAKNILGLLPRAPFEKILPSAEAEMIKYFHNVHGAVKVIFANQMYDACRASKLNYDLVKECAAKSKHILTDMYLNVWHGRYRGYGGSCFPKDIRTLIHFGNKKGVNLTLLETAEKINNQLMKKQKISDPEKLGINKNRINNYRVKNRIN